MLLPQLNFVLTDAADCQGDCTELTVPGEVSAKLWFDSDDRAAASLETAFRTCAGVGGHLASERDLTEAIWRGLPNGSNTPIFTADVAVGAELAAPNAMIVTWDGKDTTYDDLPPSMDWSSPMVNHPYRCMWTNEVR